MINSFSTNKEFQAQVTDGQRLEMLRGLVENYYYDKGDKTAVFDTSRAWQKWADLLVQIWPNVKIICCVRDVAWIADSLERLHKRRPWATNYFWGNNAGVGTVHDRAGKLTDTGNMVGYALGALSEGLKSKCANHLLVVDYDLLTTYPCATIQAIYKWLNIPYYEGHNFANVEFDNKEYDSQHGVEGLHDVRPVVSPNIRETCLPKEIFNKMKSLTEIWKKPGRTTARFIMFQEEKKEGEPEEKKEMPDKAEHKPEIDSNVIELK
jgi:sulfotransferase